MESIRDWLVIYAGILWLLLTLVWVAIFAALWWLTRLALKAAGRGVSEKVRPALEKAHTQAAVLQDKTSRLPGNIPTPEGEVVRAGGLRLPSRKKRRRFLPSPR
ncbi:MAG: hypothetical protein HYX51_04960 [Chloroflexi bacterium]|nr:hypothetical protein [Chloroflexota bacterium]